MENPMTQSMDMTMHDLKHCDRVNHYGYRANKVGDGWYSYQWCIDALEQINSDKDDESICFLVHRHPNSRYHDCTTSSTKHWCVDFGLFFCALMPKEEMGEIQGEYES